MAHRNGQPGARAIYAELVHKARRRGESYRLTCEQLGISRTYYYDLLHDPTGAKIKARRDSYRQPCPRCGTPMNGSNGRNGKAPKLCTRCKHKDEHEGRRWTPEAIIEAIRYFEAIHGRPPTAPEFSPALNGHVQRTAVDYANREEGLPSFGVVVREFGTWNAAIKAAGFTPNKVGAKPRGFLIKPGIPRSFDYHEALRRRDAGERVRAIADSYGVHTWTIYRACSIAALEQHDKPSTGSRGTY